MEMMWGEFGEVAREALDCCKQSSMGDSGGDPGDQTGRNVDSTHGVLRLQKETRAVLETGLGAMHGAFWERTCVCFVHALRLCMRLTD